LRNRGAVEQVCHDIRAQAVDTLHGPVLGLVLAPREIALDKLVK